MGYYVFTAQRITGDIKLFFLTHHVSWLVIYMRSQTDPADHSTLLIRMTFHRISFHGLSLKDKALWPTSPSALCFDPFWPPECLPILLWYSFYFQKRLDTIVSFIKCAILLWAADYFRYRLFETFFSPGYGTRHWTQTTLSSNKKSETAAALNSI